MNYLLYDYMQVAGGAERVTLTLARELPECTTVVSRVYPECAPLLARSPDTAPVDIIALGNAASRWLGRIPEAIYNFRHRARLVARADSVIYSGFYAPLAVRHQHSGQRIYYCHTLPRFAYDLFEQTRARLPVGSRWLFDIAAAWLRREYRESMLGMDVIVANSDNVRARLRKYLDIDARVVHPPVDTDDFRWLDDEGYYLSTARLTANKRVDVIVEAFRQMPDKRLIVVSGGPELDRLRLAAGDAPNIHFTGWQSEPALRRLIGNARAVVYVPIDEDFGLSPVEAMAAGKPVIGVAEGGLLETVVDGETGVLIEGELSPARLIAAVERLETLSPTAMRPACENQAERFSRQTFLNNVRALLAPPSDTTSHIQDAALKAAPKRTVAG